MKRRFCPRRQTNLVYAPVIIPCMSERPTVLGVSSMSNRQNTRSPRLYNLISVKTELEICPVDFPCREQRHLVSLKKEACSRPHFHLRFPSRVLSRIGSVPIPNAPAHRQATGRRRACRRDTDEHQVNCRSSLHNVRLRYIWQLRRQPLDCRERRGDERQYCFCFLRVRRHVVVTDGIAIECVEPFKKVRISLSITV